VSSEIPSLVVDEALPRFRYDVDDYNRFYLNQLYELLTQYGPIAEVWLDGANPTSTAQTYAFEAWFDLIRRLAPDATIAVGGPDVRWVGNEDGFARETEWSVVPFAGQQMVAEQTAPDVAGPSLMQKADELRWYPAEVDVLIRPGWFYHAAEDSAVKSLPELLDIYRKSVGRNALLLLNIPPDRRGLFAPPDVDRLAEFGAAIRESFAVDGLLDGEWTQIAAGTTIGHRRLLPLDEPITPTAVRLRILSARAETVADLSVHYDPTI
jgi:alpha-L-fucosidase